MSLFLLLIVGNNHRQAKYKVFVLRLEGIDSSNAAGGVVQRPGREIRYYRVGADVMSRNVTESEYSKQSSWVMSWVLHSRSMLVLICQSIIGMMYSNGKYPPQKLDLRNAIQDDQSLSGRINKINLIWHVMTVTGWQTLCSDSWYIYLVVNCCK